MQLSSELCRAQEAIQRARATDASLDKVRGSALEAAAAWQVEAEEAERREERYAARKLAASNQTDDGNGGDELVDALLEQMEDTDARHA